MTADRTALVTGAHGFIGRNTAKALAAAGFRVTGMGLGDWTAAEWRDWGLSAWHPGMVTLEALQAIGETPGVIVHCAGGSSVAVSMTDPQLDFLLTVESTLAVLEYQRRLGTPGRIVFVSTGSVYGAVEGVASEERSANPESPYARHKLMAEDLCREYGKHFGVRSVVARLFSVHGPGLRKQLLWDACNKFERGEWRFAGTGREVRDWVHVEDAAALLVLAGQHASTESPIVNGGTGEAVTVAQVLGELALAWDQRGALAFSGEPRPGDPMGFVADCRRAKGWGWSPSVDWREGVRRYATWFKRTLAT